MSDQPRRRPGEIAPERLAEIYSRTAAFYDAVAQPFQEQTKLAVLALADPGVSGRLLELAVGTGWLFERLVARFAASRVAGVELAAGMLDVARQRLGAKAGEVALALADATALPFAPQTFGAIVSTYMLEVLPQAAIEAVLAECRRVLRPGGSLAVASLTEGRGADHGISEDWRRRFERDPEAFGGARPVSLAPALGRAGFRLVQRRYLGGEGSWPSEVLLARRP